MKLLVLVFLPSASLAASWSNFFSKSSASLAVSQEGHASCIAYTKKFITKPVTKGRAIESAVDHCALDKKIDDANFVCPHYKEVLVNALARESTKREFTAETFCGATEAYVLALKTGAANIPNMGTGEGTEFKVSKDCQPIVLSFMKPETTLPSTSTPDMWYGLCMQQDCAHFLPSRTRWCTEDHQPTHSAAVCEAIRTYAKDEVTVFGSKRLDAAQVCGVYDEFVQDTHINVEAYLHVVHGKATHPVPEPANKERALQSSQMKNEAEKNKLRDGAGVPVKSAAIGANAFFGLVSFMSAFAYLCLP